MSKKIKMIAAVCEDWGIGFENRLLCSIPEDMAFFKQKTLGNVIVMGRKTFESFPGKKPLKDRIHMVLTSDRGFLEEKADIKNLAFGGDKIGMNPVFEKEQILNKEIVKREVSGEVVYVVHNMEEAFLQLEKYTEKEIFVIGGGSVYEQFLAFADEIFLTHIKVNYPADTFFPNLSQKKEWKLAESSESRWYEGLEYQFCRYVRDISVFDVK